MELSQTTQRLPDDMFFTVLAFGVSAMLRSAAELSRRSEALDTLKRDLSDAHHQLHNVKAQTRQKEEDSQATTQAASALRAALSEAHVLKRAAEEQV